MNEPLVIKHPLIDHSLTILRNRDTRTTEFRQHASIVSKILLVEATRHIKLEDVEIVTPLAPMTGRKRRDKVLVVPVLRAGLAMLFAAQDFLLDVPVGFIGLERDEQTAVARAYYQKIPGPLDAFQTIVLDPMLATGGSIDDTVTTLKDKGAQNMVLACIVAAPEGIARVIERHPDVRIITCAVDECLNEHMFIVPGLGDFGDRYFGTE